MLLTKRRRNGVRFRSPRIMVATALCMISCFYGINYRTKMWNGTSHTNDTIQQNDSGNHHHQHNNSNNQTTVSKVGEAYPMDQPLNEIRIDGSSPVPILKQKGRSQLVNISVVVPLRFEMGNHLSQIAHGYGVLLEARRDGQLFDLTHQKLHPKDLNLVLLQRPRRDQKNETKYTYHKSLKDLYQCFPNLRPFLFGRYGNGTTNHFEHAGNERHQGAFHVNHTNQIQPTLRALTRWLADSSSRRASNPNPIVNSNSTTTSNNNNNNWNSNTTFVSLIVDMDYVAVDYLADKYYGDYRSLFYFDHDTCCAIRPDPDESVYHFRNYATEMRHHAKLQGFEELEPHRVANELFPHLQPGDKVAITTRFRSRLRRLVQSLEERGLQVRVVKQSGVEDFCFLLHAQKELVGVAESTFVLWAAYLGNATKVRLYSMDSVARRNATTSLFAHRVFVHYNWTNPKLQQKILFELRNSDATKR